MEVGRGLGVIAAFAAAAFVWVTLLMPETPAPALREFAGVYANPCCGSFTIDEKRLSTKVISTPAETGWDKKGVFILPERYFGVEHGKRIGVESGFPMKLYVNRRSTPMTIQVWDVGASSTYEFAKIATPARIR